MARIITLLSVTAVSLMMSNVNAQEKLQYPTTDMVQQVDEYFGTKIADPYRWLENDTSAQTEAWVNRQIDFTEAYLSKIPFRQKIKDRLTEVWNYARYGAPTQYGSYYVFAKNDGLQPQSVLYIQKGIKGKPEVLLDPNTLSTDGTVALQAIGFSKNQKYFAYSVSASGSDWQEIYIMDMATRKLLPEKIEFVKFTGIAWNGDRGFYYSGYERPADEKLKYSAKTEYQKIYYHAVGTPQSEDGIIYEDREHPLRYVGADLTEDERYLILGIAEGTDGSEIKVMDLKNPRAGFKVLVPGFATNADVIGNVGNKLIVKTNHNAPNYKIVSIDLANTAPAAWKTIVPEQKEPLSGASTAGGKIFATYLKDANSKVVQYNMDGKGKKDVKLPGIGTVGGFGGRDYYKDFYYTFTSFTQPATIYKYNIATGKSTLYRKSEIKFDVDNYVTKQVFYTSKDGTKVPMFITHKKGIKMDGNNPTLLYAYGGFNISLTPSFSVANTAFLENGGVYCLANLRGGAEYGEAWHQGGMLEKKQNVFDDFIAAAEYLIANKYTQPSRLAIRGGSNGGLLVGAVMTQRPELFKVAIPQVGVLDMLRYHKFTVGWGWVVEYGSSDKQEDFNYLIKYSPLHNVRPNVCYPSTMITTADHDDRVVPAHSFKFAAELQRQQACAAPALIRIDKKAGHGAGKPTAKQIEEAADIISFIFYEMGVKL